MPPLNIDRFLRESRVCQYYGRHCLHYGHCARKDTWIVPASAYNFYIGKFARKRTLFFGDCCGWLKRNLEIQRLPRSYSSQNTAGIVCFCCDGVGIRIRPIENIIVLRAEHSGSRKSAPDFKSLCCGDGKHCFCQIRFYPIKNGVSAPCWTTFHPASYDSPYAVSYRAGFFYKFNHAQSCRLVRAARRGCVYVFLRGHFLLKWH